MTKNVTENQTHKYLLRLCVWINNLIKCLWYKYLSYAEVLSIAKNKIS